MKIITNEVNYKINKMEIKQMKRKRMIDQLGYLTGYGMPEDEYGNPVARTKDKYPYTYDGFVTWRGGENSQANSCVYSDRITQQEPQKARELMIKHFGNDGDYYFERKPKQIEAFLSDYYGQKVKLILIMEYCNVSSGYALWRFDFHISSNG